MKINNIYISGDGEKLYSVLLDQSEMRFFSSGVLKRIGGASRGALTGAGVGAIFGGGLGLFGGLKGIKRGAIVGSSLGAIMGADSGWSSNSPKALEEEKREKEEFNRIHNSEWKGVKTDIERWKNSRFIKDEYKKAEKEKGILLPQEFWKLLDILPKFIPVAKKIDPESKYPAPIEVSAFQINTYDDELCLISFPSDPDFDISWDYKKNQFSQDLGTIRSIKSKLLKLNSEEIKDILYRSKSLKEEPDKKYIEYLQAWSKFIESNL